MSRNRGHKPSSEPEPVEATEPGPERNMNDRVIHTRVPESLDTELKDQARRLGMSVSNLIRNLLANAVGVVNDFVAEGDDIVRSARDTIDSARAGRRAAPARAAYAAPMPTPAPPTPAPPTIVGWQPVVLERNALCHTCNAILPRGSDAALAAIDGAPFPGPRPTLCIPCLEELRHGPVASESARAEPDDD
jgi:hypothetical protein